MSAVRARARWLLSLLPAIVAAAAAIWWVSGAGLLAALRAVRPGPLAAGIALQVTAAIVLGLRWRATLEGVGVRPLPRRRAATVLSLRAQAAAVLAPGGLAVDVLRAVEAGYGSQMLGKLAKVAILERWAGATVLAIVCAVSTLPLLVPRWGGPAAIILVALLVCGALVSGMTGAASGLLWLRPVLGWTAANQLLALSGLAAGLAATGIQTSTLALLSIASVAAFATMVPLSFNGYGVRELALALLAPRLGLDGKKVVAAGLVASTILLAGLVIAALLARLIPIGERDDERSAEGRGGT